MGLIPDNETTCESYPFSPVITACPVIVRDEVSHVGALIELPYRLIKVRKPVITVNTW